MTSGKAVTTKRGKVRFKFISETIAELKKVIWLSRREAIYLTTLVLIISVAMGIILGIIDFGFTQLVNNVLIGG
ncbi:MAG: preprotein translocase subunit SecE [Chloroflexi bacterium]|nr:preprotein translocase subunit SecE [Chloroflexota bacterium]